MTSKQLAHLTDAGLCHGWAGLVHTARRAAADATASDLATAAAADGMSKHLRHHGSPVDDGLLEGATGPALVSSPRDFTRPATRPEWDTCLLVT